MELTGLGPHGKLGDEVEFAQELTYHLAGVVSLAELFELRQDAIERFFGLADSHIRIILALAFETRMMFQEFFPVEGCEALARRTPQGASWT
jgi:hypothetical protein